MPAFSASWSACGKENYKMVTFFIKVKTIFKKKINSLTTFCVVFAFLGC